MTKTKKSNTVWPKVVEGSHLTVTTHEDGRTELVWDDNQLLKEVREAIASISVPKKPKAPAKTPAKKAPAKKAPAKTPAKKTPTKKVKAK